MPNPLENRHLRSFRISWIETWNLPLPFKLKDIKHFFWKAQMSSEFLVVASRYANVYEDTVLTKNEHIRSTKERMKTKIVEREEMRLSLKN